MIYFRSSKYKSIKWENTVSFIKFGCYFIVKMIELVSAKVNCLSNKILRDRMFYVEVIRYLSGRTGSAWVILLQINFITHYYLVRRRRNAWNWLRGRLTADQQIHRALGWRRILWLRSLFIGRAVSAGVVAGIVRLRWRCGLIVVQGDDYRQRRLILRSVVR